jgi:endonuclease G, mitochondrial
MAKPTLIIPYDPFFLGDGFEVPMPTLGDAARGRALGDGQVFHYTHYSLVMDRERRTAMFAANNIDAARKVQIGGGLSWKMDERLGEVQLGRETYDGNQLDKGHLVRREDVVWGPVAEAREANRSTYFYPNATPQHQNFNQDEWKALEDWVLEHATELSYRLCVLTGTVLRDDDPTLLDLPPHLRTLFGPARLPAAFWKVIVLRDGEAGGGDLAAVAFALKQSEAWNDRQGSRLLQLRIHQVTLGAIEEWTGLNFGALHDVDELAGDRIRNRAIVEGAEWPEVAAPSDIVWSGSQRRAEGRRAVRSASATGLRSLAGDDARAASDCSCDDGFDAKAAITGLSTQMADVIGQVAALQDGHEVSTESERTRSVVVSAADTVDAESAPETGADDDAVGPAEDPRVIEMINAAPPELAEQVGRLARSVVQEGKYARGEVPRPAARIHLRVVGGDIVPPGGFPSCVCVGTPGWGCSGVLVAPQIVLTAAHCGAAIDRIMVGGESVAPLGAGARVIAVRRAAIHPRYRRHPYNENDILVLVLDKPANVLPMRLASSTQIEAASAFEVVGFGYNDPVKPLGFGIKRRVTIDLAATMARPGQGLGQLPTVLGFHPEYEFVMGRKTLGRDSCNGDSGGPIYIRGAGGFLLAGLTSRATRTAVANCGDGGIYVRPLMFLDFINTIAGEAGLPAVPSPS